MGNVEQELNFREELVKAREVASKVQMHGRESEIDAYWEMLCGLVLVAEEDLKEQQNEWEIASLAREFLQYARPLEGFDHMLSKLYSATKRMVETLSDHPRLKAELIEFEILVVERGQEVNGGGGRMGEYLREDLDELYHNIALADEGKLDEIEQKGHLKHDPIEWTARWEEIIDEADREVFRRLGDHPRGMGLCHAYWHERASVLQANYGLRWRSPAIMNPRVHFD